MEDVLMTRRRMGSTKQDMRTEGRKLVLIPPRIPTRRSLDGEALGPFTPTILGAGVDTLEMSFDVEVSDEMWARLEGEREEAQRLAEERRADHCPEWLGACLRPTGARGGYRFLIETPYFSIKLLRGVPHRPPIFVELRAFGLHTHQGGAGGACEAACAYLREVLLVDRDPAWVAEVVSVDTARCSRLDLYVDWQGGWPSRLRARRRA